MVSRKEGAEGTRSLVARRDWSVCALDDVRERSLFTLTFCLSSSREFLDIA